MKDEALNEIGTETEALLETWEALDWLEQALPRIMRRLMDSENLDMPLLQLPLAQMRLAQALYNESDYPGIRTGGETMGRLSERLGVRHNALTQAADRLINHSLAERLSDPHDRRVVRLRLTEKGCLWVGERRARRRARLSAIWNALLPQEREAFVEAVRLLESVGNRLPDTAASDSERARSSENGAQLTVEETLSRFTVGAAGDAAARMVNR